MTGKIKGISGPTVSIEMSGLKLYDMVYVGNAMLTGEVVRLEKDRTVVQVYEDTRGLGIGEPVKGAGMPLTVRLYPELLSGMFDGLQRLLKKTRDDIINDTGETWPVRVPRPYKRKLSPSEPLITGQRCIDFLFPIARGGTVIMPGGFGTGKTILEQSIAKFADVDIVVYVGCGERGNEMAELIDDFSNLTDPWTGRGLMERTILVVNTSNMPVAAREASIYTAVTMAEYYRDMGYHVLLLADSLSRWAEALREISSSLEEMPGEEGYPTYLASRLSAFFERAGVVETLSGKVGSLSMVLSVSPPGGDFTEPVTQACLRAAGAFLMLDTSLAHRRHFPAINYFQSYSLYAKDVISDFKKRVSSQWEELMHRCKEMLQREDTLREVAEIVGIQGLQDADRLLMKVSEMIRLQFLCQDAYTEDAFSPPEKTVSKIADIIAFYDKAEGRLKEGVSLDEIWGANPDNL